MCGLGHYSLILQAKYKSFKILNKNNSKLGLVLD